MSMFYVRTFFFITWTWISNIDIFISSTTWVTASWPSIWTVWFSLTSIIKMATLKLRSCFKKSIINYLGLYGKITWPPLLMCDFDSSLSPLLDDEGKHLGLFSPSLHEWCVKCHLGSPNKWWNFHRKFSILTLWFLSEERIDRVVSTPVLCSKQAAVLKKSNNLFLNILIRKIIYSCFCWLGEKGNLPFVNFFGSILFSEKYGSPFFQQLSLPNGFFSLASINI